MFPFARVPRDSPDERRKTVGLLYRVCPSTMSGSIFRDLSRLMRHDDTHSELASRATVGPGYQ